MRAQRGFPDIAVMFMGSTLLTPLYILYKQAFGFDAPHAFHAVMVRGTTIVRIEVEVHSDPK